MANPQALTIHVPIHGEVLVRFGGSEDLHPMGTFEQSVPVVLDPGNGTVLFNWTPEVRDHIRDRNRVGEPTPLLQHPDKSTYDLLYELLLKEPGLERPEVLAEKILNTLGNEGRISA